MALQKENPKFRLFKSYIIAFFWIGTAIFIDQITKYFAVAYLKNNHAKVLIDGVFELQYLENRGMAFGILQNKQFLFVALWLYVERFSSYTGEFHIQKSICLFVSVRSF